MSILRIIFGALVGAITIYWLFHDIDWEVIFSTIKSAQINQLIAGFVCMILSQLTRALRWHIIVEKSFHANFSNVYTASQIGLLFNFIIPARLGEIVRAYLLAKDSKTTTPVCLGTIIVEKSFDLIMMLVALLLLSFYISRHGELYVPAFSESKTSIAISHDVISYGFFVISGVLILILSLLVMMYLNNSIVSKQLRHAMFFIPKKLGDKFTNLIKQIANGLHILGSTKALLITLLWSFLIWFLSYLAIYFIIAAVLGNIPLIVPFIILVMIAIFIAVPIVPGLVGQYHLAVIIGLLFFYPEMPREMLGSLALMTHSATLLVLTVLGIGSILHSHIPSISTLLSLSKNKRT